MTCSASVFDEMMTSGEMSIRNAPLLTVSPEPISASWDRVGGMWLGLAIGNVLGNTSEGLTPRDRKREHGEIRDFRPNWKAQHMGRGTLSDYSQLAIWTVEHLV